MNLYLSLVFITWAFLVGFLFKEILDGLRVIIGMLAKLLKAKEKQEAVEAAKPPSVMVEPMSAAAFARQQHDKMMEELNK